MQSESFAWWPTFVGGLAWPFLTKALQRLMPMPAAAFVAFVCAFGGAGLYYAVRPPSPAWTSGRWLAGTFTGALAAAVVTYLLPW